MGSGNCQEAYEKYGIPDCQVCPDEIRNIVKGCYFKDENKH